MKLMKATLRRLWHLTRATSFVVGLAVMVALVGGVVSLALAKPPHWRRAASLWRCDGGLNLEGCYEHRHRRNYPDQQRHWSRPEPGSAAGSTAPYSQPRGR